MQWAKVRFFPQAFFEDKIRELQAKKWHAFENNNFGVALSNVRKI